MKLLLVVRGQNGPLSWNRINIILMVAWKHNSLILLYSLVVAAIGKDLIFYIISYQRFFNNIILNMHKLYTVSVSSLLSIMHKALDVRNVWTCHFSATWGRKELHTSKKSPITHSLKVVLKLDEIFPWKVPDEF